MDTTLINTKFKLLDWIGLEEVVVDKGRWSSYDLKVLVHYIPLGPQATKV